jgi:hypothetical protein
MARRSDGLHPRRGYHYFKWKDIDGHWHEHATRTRSYAEARLIRTRFLAEQALRKIPAERARWTLQQAVDQRLIDRKPRIASSSFASEASIMRTLLRLLGSGARLEKLADMNTIRRYETNRLQEGVTTKSVNNEVLVLTGILRDAKLWRLVEPDYKSLPVKESDVPDALTREEAHRLLQVAKAAGEDSVAPLVAVVAYSTGMRSKEIKELQLGSIRLHSERHASPGQKGDDENEQGCPLCCIGLDGVLGIRETPQSSGAPRSIARRSLPSAHSSRPPHSQYRHPQRREGMGCYAPTIVVGEGVESRVRRASGFLLTAFSNATPSTPLSLEHHPGVASEKALASLGMNKPPTCNGFA